MGHVESVDIEGFKCLKSVSLECGQFNLITGRNGTGKSSVLEAIELGYDPQLIGRYSKKLPHVINIDSDSASVTLHIENEDRHLSLRLPNERETVESVWELADQIRESQGDTEDNELLKALEKRSQKSNAASSKYEIEDIQSDILVIESSGSEYTFVDSVDWVSDMYPDGMAGTFGQLVDSGFLAGPENRGRFIENRPPKLEIRYMRNYKWRSQIEEESESVAQVRVRDFLREHDIFPNLESFSFDELVFDEDGEQYAIPYDFLGDGTKTIIGIVWQLVADDEIPDVVLLEEPENHLHPGYVKELVPFLIDFAREEDVQLFVTSHNVDFISELLSDSLSEDHREWLAEEFRLIQMTNLSPKQFDYDRAKHHTEELHLDLRGL